MPFVLLLQKELIAGYNCIGPGSSRHCEDKLQSSQHRGVCNRNLKKGTKIAVSTHGPGHLSRCADYLFDQPLRFALSLHRLIWSERSKRDYVHWSLALSSSAPDIAIEAIVP